MDNLTHSKARYVHTDSTNNKMGIMVNGAGFSRKRRKNNSAWQRTLDEYAIVLLTKGHGQLETSATIAPIKLNAGDLFILFPGVNHSYFPTAPEGWAEYWVMFSGHYPSFLQEMGLLNPKRPVHRSVGQQIPHLLMGILSNLDRTSPSTDSCILKLVELFIFLKGSNTGKQLESRNTYVSQAKDYISSAPEIEIDFESLALELGTSYSNLRKLFKKQTGLPLKQYQLCLQLNMAKELLKGSNLTVKEVAFKCGFCDPYYFSRIFRQKTGVSPTEWRK